MGNNSEKRNKILKKAITIIGIFFSVIFIAVFLCWGGINVLKFAIYQDFYKLSEDVASIPGIKDGFIVTGITYLSSDEAYCLVGTMNDDSVNKLYIVNSSNEMKSYTLLTDGVPFKAQNMDICYSNGTLYLVNELDEINNNSYGIYKISFEDIKNSNGTIDIKDRIATTNTKCSFIFCDENSIFVGESSLEDNAKLIEYSISDLEFETPVNQYLIPKNVKGMALKDTTLITISNYEFSNTFFNFYDLNNTFSDDFTLNDGISYKYLNEPIRTIKGPLLLNGLDINSAKEKILLVGTSGSSKYVFGSMFFSNKIREMKVF